MPYVIGFNVKALTPRVFLHFNVCLPTDDNLGNEEGDQEKDNDENKEGDTDISAEDENEGIDNDKNTEAGEGMYIWVHVCHIKRLGISKWHRGRQI